MNKLFFILLLVISGCVTQRTVTVDKAVLLPEDRIFTVPAGQKIDVLLDGQQFNMTFPYDMKLVSPNVLVRQEEKLNDVLFEKLKIEKKKNTIVGILGSAITLFGGIFVYINNRKKKEDKK